MSDAPETIEYVLQPIVSDKGAMPIIQDDNPLVVYVSLTDLADGLTVIAVPEGLRDDSLLQLRNAIEQRAKDGAGQFIIVEGDISQWRFAKLIRRDRWDADCREPA